MTTEKNTKRNPLIFKALFIVCLLSAVYSVYTLISDYIQKGSINDQAAFLLFAMLVLIYQYKDHVFKQ
jgi:uncharacterized membrane protein